MGKPVPSLLMLLLCRGRVPLGASRTAAPRIGEASCNPLPKVPPTRYEGNPLVQVRQCGTVHFLRPRIHEKSYVYG
jgi:hypothetical protein